MSCACGETFQCLCPSVAFVPELFGRKNPADRLHDIRIHDKCQIDRPNSVFQTTTSLSSISDNSRSSCGVDLTFPDSVCPATLSFCGRGDFRSTSGRCGCSRRTQPELGPEFGHARPGKDIIDGICANRFRSQICTEACQYVIDLTDRGNNRCITAIQIARLRSFTDSQSGYQKVTV
jgi:hypothetical protein